MDLLGFPSQAAFQEPAEFATDRNAHIAQHFSRTSSPYLPQDQTNMGGYLNPNSQHNCDIKPRLTKEQHDILEAHFQKQNKPSTITKKSFAETLNVSLEKVNNWFQNRRAKSKQESKKHAGSSSNLNSQQSAASDTDVSPGFVDTSSDYYALMKQWSGESQMTNGLGIHPQENMNGLPFNSTDSNFLMPQQYNSDAYSSQLELNRRTLTQEAFDAMANNVEPANGTDFFSDLPAHFTDDQTFSNQVFADLSNDLKSQEAFAFPHPLGAPMPSNDSTVPSIMSEHSMHTFPSASNMQDPLTLSTTSSDWTDSRSSSLHEQPARASSQWQPGQSVPVDFNAHEEHFRQIDQARSSEQPLAWPADEAFGRRDSTTSLLAHNMSNVGIQTPHPQHSFKSPAPPSTSTLAARRQRPKPANLGLAALRSVSHTGAVPPVSPRQFQQPLSANPEQQLRRIKSSNVVGSMAPGRVMKSMPGSAQRSPLSWTFADAMNSPHAIRHASTPGQGNLAPPTPMSPREIPKFEQAGQYQGWPGNIARHASMSETDLFNPAAPMMGQKISSPPHTPMYYQQHFAPQRFGSSFLTENTPPQSAPASQSCFPSNVFSLPPQPHPQPPMQHHVPSVPMSQQHFMLATVPDQQFPPASFTFAPNQQANIPTSGPPPGMPLQFTNGTPVINAEGHYEVAFPAPQMQYAPSQQLHSVPQMIYPYGASAGVSPTLQGNGHSSKPSSDFFVHEYNPPESVKSASTPPRTMDTGPKTYTFSNSGPEYFEDRKQKKADRESGTISSSPASSYGTASSL